MRPKSLLLLALALGCGLVASIGISQVMDRNSGGQAKIETVQVYVALHNINLGDPIEAAMISLQEWPKGKVPKGAISKLEDLEGRRPRTAIFEGEPILEAKLLAPGQIADPIRSIQKGMRLKTISVDAEKSAGGLLGPGDRVDVQLFVRKDQKTGVEAAKSKVILQNIRVFAVDQTVQRSPDGSEEKKVAKTVSLMLTPEQASKLSLAEQIGEISLIPRNPDDEATADGSEYTVEDLLSGSEANSRAKEQGVASKPAPTEEHHASENPLVSAITTPLKATKEPFRMEIVEAQGVREMLFDSDTGRPINRANEEKTPAGPVPHSATSAAASAGEGDTPPPAHGDAAKMLEDFPINFDGQKK